MVTIKNRAGRRARALLKAFAPVVLTGRFRRGPGSAKRWVQGVVLGGLTVVLSACMPAGPRALLDGKKLLERGQYAQAVEKLERATSVLTNNAVAWNYLGLAYHHAGRTTDAARAYQRALGLNHDLAEAHYNLGCLWLDQRKAESAKLELITYTLRRSDSAEGFTKLGAAQLQLREYTAAEKSFSDALRLGERNPEAWTGLGVARAQKGRVVEAAQALNTALKQQPNYAPALLDLAIFAQQSLRDRALALQKYREYLVLQPAAENAETVRGIVRQLEQEIPPPTRPPTNIVAVRPGVGTNSPPARAGAFEPAGCLPAVRARDGCADGAAQRHLGTSRCDWLEHARNDEAGDHPRRSENPGPRDFVACRLRSPLGAGFHHDEKPHRGDESTARGRPGARNGDAEGRTGDQERRRHSSGARQFRLGERQAGAADRGRQIGTQEELLSAPEPGEPLRL